MSNDNSAQAQELLPPYLPPRRPKSLPNLTRSRTSWHISAAGIPPLPKPGAAAKRSVSRPRKRLTKRRPVQDIGRTAAASPPAIEHGHAAIRPTSYQSFSSGDTAAFNDGVVDRDSSIESGKSYPKSQHGQIELSRDEQQSTSERGNTPTNSTATSPRSSREGQRPETKAPSRTTSGLASIPDGVPLSTQFAAPTPVRPGPKPGVLRKSSLRIETRLSDEDMAVPKPQQALLGASHSDPQLRRGKARPYSHPASKSNERVDPVEPLPSFSPPGNCLLQSPTSPPPSRRSTPTSQREPFPKPRASLKRLSSLDHFLSWQEEKAEWKRASASYHQASPAPSVNDQSARQSVADNTPVDSSRPSRENDADLEAGEGGHSESPKEHSETRLEQTTSQVPSEVGDDDESKHRVFRHPSAEWGFVITVAIMQLLSEYLITGFALELPSLLDGRLHRSDGAMGLFWPAVLLTLIMGSTLLFFARVSDIYGGYPCFMFGILWLTIWTVIPGVSDNLILLDVARAMQGLAIAAYTPSTFAMIAVLYPGGPRRNIVMGIVAGCAPVGFFAGFLVAGALPETKTSWYFYTAAIVSFVMLLVAFGSVPKDREDRNKWNLDMDWTGAGLITAGLVSLAFALSVEPYAGPLDSKATGFSFPVCYAPFAAGIVCLAIAFWYEGWIAKCPLLPFDFFTPKSAKALAAACLCFYGSYGVWLYTSAEFFRSQTGTTKVEGSIHGIELASWYAPTAIGGLILCVSSSKILHKVHITIVLLVSGLAWIGAPLLLAVAPLPLSYWPFVFPSMLCATIGLDLTYTISLIYGSSVQPLKYQGLSGAICSSLINLAMSFALPISEIARSKGRDSVEVLPGDEASFSLSFNKGYQAAFFYGVASAGVGFVICACFVRIPRSAVNERPVDEERPRAAMSDATLVDEDNERTATFGPEAASEHAR